MTDSTTTKLPLRPGRWTLDAAHSSIGFAVRHLGISKVRGVFSGAEVALDVGETVEATSLEAVIDIGTIDTNDTDRDAHVRSPDMLDVERRPTMRFVSTEVTGSGDEWQIDGELTIGEVSQPVTLAAELGGIEVFPMDGTTHAGFEATATIDRHDFGLNFGMLDAALGRKVQINLDIQLCEPASEESTS